MIHLRAGRRRIASRAVAAIVALALIVAACDAPTPSGTATPAIPASEAAASTASAVPTAGPGPSYTHRDFRDLTAAEIRDELRRTEVAIAPYCSQDPRPFFRPPNGGYDVGVLAAMGAAGYPYTILWDIDTIDWRPIVNDPPGPTANQIVTKVLGTAQGGSIVLMHLGGYETYEALPRIVEGLRAAGFDLVTLDELL